MHLRPPPPPLPRLTLLYTHPALQKMKPSLHSAARRGSTSPLLHRLALPQMVTAAAERNRSVLSSGLAALATHDEWLDHISEERIPCISGFCYRSGLHATLSSNVHMQTLNNEHTYPQEGYCEVCRQ